MLLFLYGTLLDPAVLDRHAAEPGLHRRLRPARLRGFARVALRGTPYPTLMPRPGAVTEGAVLRAGPAARRRLAAYEGPEYRLMPVRLDTPRGPVRARAWIMAPFGLRAEPSAGPWPCTGRPGG